MAKNPTVKVTFVGEDQTGPAIEQVQGKLGGLSGILGKLGLAAGLAGVGTALLGIGRSALQTNSDLETSALQFETLLGSADLAREHIQRLYDFAAKTPFETKPIIDASRYFEIFGGQSLDTSENLKLVGDAAAVSGQSIDQVAFWVGRAYSAMQSGQPFGEASMRLQEMGILSSEARQKLDELQKSGAGADEKWKVLTESLQKFNGAMEKQASTLPGLASTIKDNLGLLIGSATSSMFDGVKTILGSLASVLQTDQISQMAQQISTSLQPLFSMIGQQAQQILPILIPLLGEILSLLAEIVGTIGAPLIEVVGQLLTLALEIIKTLMPLVKAILPPLAQIISALLPIITNLVQTVLVPILPLIQVLVQLLVPIINAILPAVVALLNILVPILNMLINVLLIPLIRQITGLTQVIKLLSSTLSPVIDAIGKGLVGALKSVGSWIDGVARKVGDFAKKLSSIKLPKWLTPGSPTPFELGLRGIYNALQDLNSSGMGNWINSAPSMNWSLGKSSFSSGGAVIINYSPMFSTANEFEVRTKLAPIIQSVIRGSQKGVIG